jgi:hypothetical protein
LSALVEWGQKEQPPDDINTRRPRRKVPLTVETLPAVMIAELEALGTALLAVASSERDASLASLEQSVLEAVRASLPRLLEVVLQSSTSRLQPRLSHLLQACPECGQRARLQSWRPRSVSTICGSITFERPWYVCRSCRHGFSPVDQTLELGARERLSEGLKEWVIGLGATTSFAEGANWLKKLSGIEVSDEAVRGIPRGKDRRSSLSSRQRVSRLLRPENRQHPWAERGGCWWWRPTG